jgi:hypothetical protein
VSDVLASVSVELTANAAQVSQTFADVKAGAKSTAQSFANMGGIAGRTGEILGQGLKRSTRDVAELAAAMGAAGGQSTRLLTTITELALTGFNPLSIAIAGVGAVIALVGSQSSDVFGKKIPADLKKSADVVQDLVGLIKDVEEERLKTRAALAGVTPDQQRQAEERRGTELALNKVLKERVALEEKIAHLAALSKTVLPGSAHENLRLWYERELRRLADEKKVLDDAIHNLEFKLKKLGEKAAEPAKQAAADPKDEKQIEKENRAFDEAVKLRTEMWRQGAADIARDAATLRRTINRTLEKPPGMSPTELLEQQREDLARVKESWEEISRHYFDGVHERIDLEQEWADDVRKLGEDRAKDAADLERALTELVATGSDDRGAIIRASEQRELLAIDEHFTELLESMREHGVDEVELLKAMEEAKARVRAQAARQLAIAGDDFGEGFRAQVELARASLATLGELGAQTADLVRDGFGDLFVGMQDGAKGAEDAVLRMLSNIQNAFLRFAGDQAFAALFSALMPARMPVTGPRGANPVVTDAMVTDGVGVVKSAKAGGGSGRFRFEYHDHVGTEPQAESGGFDVDGTEVILLTVEKRLAGRVRAGGDLQQAIEQTNGTKRVPRRR